MINLSIKLGLFTVFRKSSPDFCPPVYVSNISRKSIIDYPLQSSGRDHLTGKVFCHSWKTPRPNSQFGIELPAAIDFIAHIELVRDSHREEKKSSIIEWFCGSRPIYSDQEAGYSIDRHFDS
jgi:hypothetical protein